MRGAPAFVLARPLDPAGHRTGLGLARTSLDSPPKRAFVATLEQVTAGVRR